MKSAKFKKGDSLKLWISGKERVVTRNACGGWIADDGRTLGAYDGSGNPDNPIPVLYDGPRIYIVTDKVMTEILKDQDTQAQT